MGKPKFHWEEIPLSHDVKQDIPTFKLGEKLITNPFFLNIGNPHAIFFVNDINDYNDNLMDQSNEFDQLMDFNLDSRKNT